MTTLEQIEALLNKPDLREILTPLFTEVLMWGRPQGGAFEREVGIGNEEKASLRFTPVAQLSGIPVFRVDWPGKRLPNVTQRRAVYAALAGSYVEHLLVYLTDDGRQAAFVWARRKRRGNSGQAKVELRTLPYQVGYPARTTIQQLGELAFTVDQLGLFGDPGLNIVLDRLNAAFDVESVTKAFFRAYREIFFETEAQVTGLENDAQRLFTQKLFNRLMFLVFLERKGWLTFAGRGDYLRALWEDYRQKRTGNETFYGTRLKLLFFSGLNTPNEVNVVGISDKGVLIDLIGRVPYLNGGLFEEDEDDRDTAISVPDAAFERILPDLFYHFNFTVTESTPLDVEVAVDPEMLGKIFEELVTGRHESGSYYTPKPVVAFMCREALKGYLGTTLPNESVEAIQSFVDEGNPASLRDPEAALAALRGVRACDPACGSGAYLLGLMHELLDLRAALFVNRNLDAQTVYGRKLEIIQNSLYGVDLDPFAVNIARLRLWLSLIVDYEGDNPPPLPNLEYKIEQGDSLTAPDPSGGLDLGFRSQLVDDFLEAKNKYTTAHHGEKLALREQVNKLRNDIKAWSGRSTTFEGFDWTIEFAEIFVKPSASETFTGAMAGLVNDAPGQMEMATMPPANTGFNVVLANPPYVRADAQFKHIENEEKRQQEIEKWQTFREQLKSEKIYKTLYEKWDLYIPFLERAFQLLSAGGQMVFIIPDAYNAAKYTSKSHEFFLQNTRVERIDFCTEIDLFDAGVNNTILHFSKSTPNEKHKPVRAKRWGNRDEFEENLQILPPFTQNDLSNNIFKPIGTIEVAREGFIPLESICYVSVGMVIHADERKAHLAFKAADLISDTQDKIHPKPFAEGKDLVKWYPARIRYLEYGTKRAPTLFRRPTFPELYGVAEKLISMDLAGSEPKVAYDNKKLFHNHSAWSFVPWHLLKDVVNNSIRKTAKYYHQDPLGDRGKREEISRQFDLKYILAIMNSAFARDWLKSRRRSKMHIYPDDWKPLPIAPISLEEQKPFVERVENILKEYEIHGHPLPPDSAEKVAQWEQELDDMVAKLYETE